MLEVQDLHHAYPGARAPALDGVSLQARRGEVLGLLGPNGAGKTTLMSLVAGLLPLQRGRLEIDGQPVGPQRRHDPGAMALAPQTDAFYPMLSVRQNLACFAAAGGLEARAAGPRIDEALAQVQMERHAAQRADRLSGGLRRRLNLAIALLHRPRLLLLDEPTAGVDPQSRAFLLQTLRQIAAAGTAVVFSSHLMGEVEALAQTVVILDHGHVLRAGPLAQLLGDDRSTLTLEVDPASHATLGVALSGHGSLRFEGGRVHLQLAPGHTATQALAALEAAGVQVQGARFGRASLEHTFMALTHEALRDG